MIPPAFEYLRPKTIPEALAFLAAVWRRRQDFERRAKPHPHDEVPAGSAGLPHRHQPDPRIVLHQGRGRLPKDRRTHARSRIGRLSTDSRELSDYPRHCPCDCGSPSAEYGNAGGQFGAWRPGQRSSSYDAGAGRTGGGRRAAGRESATHRKLFCDPVYDRASAMARSSARFAFPCPQRAAEALI